MSKRLLFLVVCLFTLFSLTAFAVDGTVLINQASVNAAGGFPYKITVSGSYKLSSNLTVSGSTDAIQVNADNVTLDLNGFSIIGPVTCTGTPVSCSGVAGIGVLSTNNYTTVRNGMIKGMGFGVLQLNADSIMIEEMTITHCANIAIFINTGAIRKNQIFSNGFDGIVIATGLVESNVVRSNGSAGIFVQSGAGATTVIGNSITSNGVSGLVAQNAIYGSNVFNSNGANITSGAGGVSQNNNSCGGTLC